MRDFSSAFPPPDMAFHVSLRPCSTFYFQSSGRSPGPQIKQPLVYWTWRCQVTHSLSCSSAASFTAFAKRCLSSPSRLAGLAARLDERTHDHLNKHTGTQWSLCLQRPSASVSSSRPCVLQMLPVASSVQARTRSARVRCEVDIGAPRFTSQPARLHRPPTPTPYPTPSLLLVGGQCRCSGCRAKEKGPLSHLLSMPLQAIRCNKQAEKRPFFPSSPQHAWQLNKCLNTNVGW